MTQFIALAASMLLIALGFVLPGLLRPETASASSRPDAPRRGTALSLAVLLTLLAVTVYGVVGKPDSLFAAAPAGTIDGLKSQLRHRPDDVGQLRQLAHALESARRFEEAVEIYRRLLRLRPDDADLLVEQAVTLGMTRRERLAGEPEQLIQRALAVAPEHVQALALAGSARFEQQDYAGAVAPWKRLLLQVPADSEVAVSISRSIAKAEALGRRGER